MRRLAVASVIALVGASVGGAGAAVATSATQNGEAHAHATMDMAAGATTATSATQNGEAHAHATVYVANTGDGTVTPIDTATNTAGTPIPAGTAPWGIAITPDGKTAYVTNNTSPVGSVTPIDLATNTAGTPIPIGRDPRGIAITPDGTTAYVTSYPNRSVYPIDLATNTAGSPILLNYNDGYANAIAIAPDGATAYVTTDGDYNTIARINIATNTVGTSLPVGSVSGIAITPNGATAYAAGYRSGGLIPVDLATFTAGAGTRVGRYPWAVGISPDGSRVIATSWALGKVSVVKTATNAVIKRIAVGELPAGVAFTPDGASAYVTNRSSNTVTPIDTATNTAGVAIDVGDTPQGIAITPDQAPTAAFTVSGAVAGNPTGFDASGSLPGSTPIVKYRWNFGDGTIVVSTDAVVEHVYAVPGNYRVVLKVRDAAGTSTERVFTGQTMSRNGNALARHQRSVSVDPG
jgi:YVTN family beta-propeller protein